MIDAQAICVKTQPKPLDNASMAIVNTLTNPAMQELLTSVLLAMSEYLPVVKPKLAMNQIKFWVVPSSKESDCLVYIAVMNGKFHAHVAKMTPRVVTYAVPDWLEPAVSASRQGHHLLSKISIDEQHMENKDGIIALFTSIAKQLSSNNGILPKMAA